MGTVRMFPMQDCLVPVAHTARWLRGFVEDWNILERDVMPFGQCSQMFRRNVLLSSSVVGLFYLSAFRLKCRETLPYPNK